MIVERLLLWLHLLFLVGAFGGIVFIDRLLADGSGDHPALARKGSRLGHVFLGLGLLAGLALYVLRIRDLGDTAAASHLHAVVGVKFLLFLGAAFCLGMASRRTREQPYTRSAQSYWVATCVMLVLAAALGICL